MIDTSVKRLESICSFTPPLLRDFTEAEFSYKPGLLKWSKKEILGHLIDSAVNNHQRFVRVQFENVPTIAYDQHKWNDFSYHNKMSGEEMILFWSTYNKHLAALIKLIPQDYLKRECNVGNKNNVTLEFLIKDYVVHMEHHLNAIIGYV